MAETADPGDIAGRVRRIIADELQIGEDEVRPEATIADLGADSLRALMIISALETEFGITIADEDALRITSFPTAVETVQCLLAA